MESDRCAIIDELASFTGSRRLVIGMLSPCISSIDSLLISIERFASVAFETLTLVN